jgi:hypothetical protein
VLSEYYPDMKRVLFQRHRKTVVRDGTDAGLQGEPLPERCELSTNTNSRFLLFGVSSARFHLSLILASTDLTNGQAETCPQELWI